jgi:diguanylate cyclase (GGDEF)-like protein
VTGGSARERALVSLVTAMGVLGAAVLVWSAWTTATSPPPSLGRWFVLVVTLTLLTDVTAIDLRVGRHAESYTWSELIVVLGLALLPTHHLVLTTVAVAVAYLVTGQPLVKWTLNVGSYAVGLLLAATACTAVAQGAPDWDSPQRSGAALLVGAAVWAVWNKLTTDTAIALAQDRPLPTVLRSALPSTSFVFLCNVGLAFGCLGLAKGHTDLLWVAPVCIVLAATLNRCYLQLAQDREAWRALETASRDLNALDEEVLVDVALTRVTALMQADGAELRLASSVQEVVHRASGRAMGPISPPGTPTVTVAHGQGRAGLPVQVTEACVPLAAAGEQLGSLVVTYTGAVRLSRRERSQLTAYASALAVALCNARLHAQVRSQAERSAHAALHDPLTGLPNRSLLRSHLDVGRGERPDFAVLLLDLDLFKPVNDTYGHEAGDEVLRVTAARLRGAVRPADVVARLGGDEFAVLVHDTSDVQGLAQRLEAVVSAPIALGSVTVAVGVSIGQAVHPVDGASFEGLLRVADADMYRVKHLRAGRALGDSELDLDRPGALRLVAQGGRS